MHEVNKNIFPLEWKLTDKIPVKKHNKKVFGTFICGGGSTMGYKLAGYDTLGGVEFLDKYAEVYKKNFNPKYLFIEDIREFNQRQDLPKELYNLDLLDGSPPCAAFSIAGSRERSWGKETKYENADIVKDDLVYIYCDTILKLLPKVFLLENVKGLISGNAKIYVKNIVNKLSDKYNVQIFLLNAATMGVPQKRERVFIIGNLKKLKLPKLELNFNCSPILFKELSDNTDTKTTLAPCFLKYYDLVKPGNSFSTVHEKGSYFSVVKMSNNKVCNTFIHTMSLVHNKYKRLLNKKELMAIATFPLDYNFNGENHTIMGRSVPPIMMANISNQIYLQWLSKIK